MPLTMFIRHRLRHHPSFQDWAAGAEGSTVVVVVVPTTVLVAADEYTTLIPAQVQL